MKKANSEAQILSWWASAPVKTVVACARALGLSKETVAKALDKAGVERDRTHRIAESRERLTAVERAVALLTPLWVKAYEHTQKSAVVIPAKLPCKVMFIPDVHGDIWNPAITGKALEEDCDVIVSNELGTWDAFSRFRRTRKTDTKNEMTAVGQFLDMCVGKVGAKNVLIGTSNHDSRLIKYFMDATQDVDAIDFIADMWRKALRECATIQPQFIGSSRVQVGTAVFGHPDSYGAQSTTAQNEGDKCRARWHTMGVRPPFHLIAIGHPHRLNWTMWQGEQAFCAEAGTQCFEPPYALDDNSTRPCTRYPVVNGAVACVLDRNGEVDFKSRETGLRFYGYAGLPPTEVL